MAITTESVKQMWEEFHKRIGTKNPGEPVFDSFCDNEKDSNECAQLVRLSKKRATASSLWTSEKIGIPIPKVGHVFVVTDWSGNAVCIVKVLKVSVLPYSEISDEHARIEGEGDGSLAYWREVHQAFFTRELEGLGLRFNESMPAIFEEFERVFP